MHSFEEGAGVGSASMQISIPKTLNCVRLISRRDSELAARRLVAMVPGFQPHDPQNEQPQDQPMSERLCRWGIMSTAGIARKNWQAIRNTDNATIVAVASRDAAKAKAFVDECQTQIPFDAKPDALGSYEALLSREDVDAVYIPLPT
jgi:hypothetical protein